MHANSYHLFKKHGLPHIKAGMDVLEISPDIAESHGSLRELVVAVGANYFSSSIEDSDSSLSTIQMVGELFFLCGPDRLDVVLSANVAEHVHRPWRWFAEQVRITKPGGLVISVSPISWPYHACPVDCWRIYPDGYKALFEEVGLEVVHASCESLVPIEVSWRHEHGDGRVWDTIAVGRKRGAR